MSPPISGKLVFPHTFANFPPDFIKLTCFFTYFMCFSFPPYSLTVMHLCITQCTYWTPLIPSTLPNVGSALHFRIHEVGQMDALHGCPVVKLAFCYDLKSLFYTVTSIIRLPTSLGVSPPLSSPSTPVSNS